jgi:hypothetical protein
MSAALTPERRATRYHTERVAAFALALCAGKTPQQVAAEIAARVVHTLRAKVQPSTPPRQ